MISFILTYYNQPAALEWQLSLFRQWQMIALHNSEIVIVDDGSQDKPAMDVLRDKVLPTGTRVYRVTVDIPWNQCGARNLGASVSVGEWLVYLDIDHGLSANDATAMVVLSERREPPPAKWYKFPRRYKGKKLAAAQNIFMIKKQTFCNLGKYDEDLTGEYVQDRLFIANAIREIGPPELVPDCVIDVLDCPTPALKRASARNIAMIADKLAGKVPISRDDVRFPWERLI
jgi:glycosyltransferase involved in cell wall biosynthesis